MPPRTAALSIGFLPDTCAVRQCGEQSQAIERLLRRQRTKAATRNDEIMMEKLLFHPCGFLGGHLFINGTILLVRAGQIPRGHEELIHDLTAGENECLFE